MFMPLFDCFMCPTHTIVALVGSGGKTTLMEYLACYYSATMPVLIGTTTQILYPRIPVVNCIGHTTPIPIQNGVYLAGSTKPGSPKIYSLPTAAWEVFSEHFPITLLEADGSRRLPLKGWAEYEPVVLPFTTMTIGVVPAYATTLMVTSQTVHRLPEFCALTKAHLGEQVTWQHIARIIAEPCGLFGNALGKRVLFFSQCHSPEQHLAIAKFVAEYTPLLRRVVQRIVAGSAAEGTGTILAEF